MILNDHDRLTAIHAMLDPEGTSLKSIEELILELQRERDPENGRCPTCGAPELLGPYR